MDEHTHEELKKLRKTLQAELKKNDLSPEQRSELSLHLAKISGALFSSWLPYGLFRKIIMFILIFLGIYGTIHWSVASILFFIFAAAFSPRITGEIIFAFARRREK